MSHPDVHATPEHQWAFLRQGIIEWWSPEDHDFPWRKPADEWKLLVTEILLQRTRSSAVAKLYEDFFQRFPTPESLAEASTDEVAETIYSLGLAWRAKYISQLGSELAERAGDVPDTRDRLKELPGVGPYVSGAFQVLHRNLPDSFVDSNVVRLLGRYFGFEWDGETRRRKWFLMFVERLFDHEYDPSRFGYAVLDFTREVCAPSPKCEVCPVRDKCNYAQEKSFEHLSPPS